jgi:acyl carrier protein
MVENKCLGRQHDMEEHVDKIRAFLLTYIQNHDLQNDEDIFTGGFVNSLFAMQLVLFLEGNFLIKIGREDLKLDNFRTVNSMAQLIEQKKQHNLFCSARP